MENNITLKSINLEKKYGKKTVVKNVSLELNKGEVVGLLGPNGAGKTTSFYMITGMISPTKGSVYLGDKNITNFPMYKRARLGIGYLSQEPSIFTKLSVEENIKLVLEMTNLSKKERSNRLENLLDDLSINNIRKNIGYQLSGGERRRTEICRALVMKPNFILLDEPFAGIDPIAVEEIQSIINDLKQKDIGVLITDHSVRETLSITDRAYLLYDGKILKDGSAKYLAEDQQTRNLYLGSKFKLN
tara:strand:+ start:14476 stop:15210 length:735 start_codon:yes stop_codon:yes gene_type:complete